MGFGDSVAALLYYDSQTMQEWELIAHAMGTVHLQEAGLDFGDPVVGYLDAELLSWGW